MYVTLSHPKTVHTIVCITSHFIPANDCLVFVLVKLAFVALLSGAVWVEGSCPISIFVGELYIYLFQN